MQQFAVLEQPKDKRVFAGSMIDSSAAAVKYECTVALEGFRLMVIVYKWGSSVNAVSLNGDNEQKIAQMATLLKDYPGLLLREAEPDKYTHRMLMLNKAEGARNSVVIELGARGNLEIDFFEVPDGR